MRSKRLHLQSGHQIQNPSFFLSLFLFFFGTTDEMAGESAGASRDGAGPWPAGKVSEADNEPHFKSPKLLGENAEGFDGQFRV